MKEHWKYKKPVAVVTSIALAFSLAVAPRVASARGAEDELAVGTMAMDGVPEWAVDDGADEGEAELTAQAGEGTYTVSDDRNAAFVTGGFPIFITTLFSQGVGPQAEAMFPYRGVDAQGESRLSTQAFESDPEGTTLLLFASAEGMTADECKEKLKKEAEEGGSTYDEVLKPKMEEAKKYCEDNPTYFYLDDWTIPATDGSGNSNRTLTPFMTLRDGNVLPGYQNADNTPNAQSIAAMKQDACRPPS